MMYWIFGWSQSNREMTMSWKSSIGSKFFQKLKFWSKFRNFRKFRKFIKKSREALLLYELTEREPGWRFTTRCHKPIRKPRVGPVPRKPTQTRKRPRSHSPGEPKEVSWLPLQTLLSKLPLHESLLFEGRTPCSTSYAPVSLFEFYLGTNNDS